MNSELSEDDQAGVSAIIYIQKMAGVDDRTDRALAIWRTMTPLQKTVTLDAYRVVKLLERK